MAKDAYFDNVALLLHGTGTQNSTTIVDQSKYAHNPTLYGDTHISTDQGLFGSSILLDGNGDFIEYANASEFNFAGQDFTLEVAVYLTSYKADTVATLLSKMDAATASNIAYALYIFGSASSFTSIYFDAYNDANSLGRVSVDYTFSLNTWYKIAVSRHSNTLSIAVNNSVIHTATFTTSIRTHSAPLRVGCYYPSSGVDFFAPAYIDEVRITKGVARDLTISQTEPFPDLGYQINLTLTETIAADNFVASVYDLASMVLLNTVTVTAGERLIDTLTDKPVLLVIMSQQGNIWQPNTVYNINDLVFPRDPISSPFYYKRLIAGTSGSTEPVWTVAGNDGNSSSLVYTIPDGIGIATRSAKLHANDGSTNDWERVDRMTQPLSIAPLIPE